MVPLFLNGSLERMVCKLERQFVSDAVEVRLDGAGAVERGLYVGQDVLGADVLEQVRAGDQL